MTKKHLLKVNDISEKKNFGTTTKIQDIEYNIKVLGTEFRERLEISGLFSNEGLTSIFQIGRFIVVLKRNETNTEGKMTFFDFDINESVANIKKALILEYSEEIINQWFKYYYYLNSDFEEEHDIIELVLS